MSAFAGGTGAEIGLVFLLGLRHGFDPDHIAAIDGFTFRAADERPALAPWAGALFAAGHGVSVAAVALLVAASATHLAWPAWVGDAVDWLVVGSLVLVGTLNLRALRRPAVYAPVGWRLGLMPGALRATSRPAAVFAAGMLFGLVFDTATQAAAWGAAASARDGVAGAAVVAAAFAAGMVLTDACDGRIVAALLEGAGRRPGVQRYRRAVGWAIVALSFGTAACSLLAKLGLAEEPSSDAAAALGVGAVGLAAGLLVASRARGGPRNPPGRT